MQKLLYLFAMSSNALYNGAATPEFYIENISLPQEVEKMLDSSGTMSPA